MSRRRKLLVGLASFLLLAGVIGGWVLSRWRRAEADRTARTATLRSRERELRAPSPIDAGRACELATFSILSRPHPPLAVDCVSPALEWRNPSVAKLSGLLVKPDLAYVLEGGGYGRAVCIARTKDGWAALDEDPYRLADCAFVAAADRSEDEVLAAAKGGISDQKRAVAESAIATIQAALASPPANRDVCIGLPKTSGKDLGLVETSVFAPRPAADERMTAWRRLSSPPIHVCLKIGMFADPMFGPCALDEPWRYVLAFDRSVEDPVVQESGDTFHGGTYRATIRLIDMAERSVRCERPFTFEPDPKVVFSKKSSSLREEIDKAFTGALCEAVRALGQGQLELDPSFKCAR